MIRVAIAHDHTLVREGMRRVLADYPEFHFVGEAANGDDTLEMVKQARPDVLVLDITMPGKSGLTLVTELKSRHSELPILVLSVHGEQPHATRMLQAGAAGFLSKSADREQLIAALRKVVGGGIFLCPEISERQAFDVVSGETPALPHTRLTARECEIFLMLVGGRSVSEVANLLDLSIKTVSTHKTNLMEKLGVKNMAELMYYAFIHGLAGPVGN